LNEEALNKCPYRTTSVTESADSVTTPNACQPPPGISPAPSATEAFSSIERHCNWSHIKSDFNHCDTLVHTRLNTFFVAQAFLFVAFMNNKTSLLPNSWIALLGMVFTFSYWIAVVRMEATVASLKEEFKTICLRFASTTGDKGNRLSVFGSKFSSYQWLVWVVPFVTFWTWVALFFSSLWLAVFPS
jgi:hypothetical protein